MKMKSKLQRKIDGPGWIEVICGAALSVVLGVVLAVAFLVFKPVTSVKELPKEPVDDMVYYIEGTREGSKIREVSAKKRLIAQGQSVTLNEDELNTLVMPPVAPRNPKNLELPATEKSTDKIVPGLPNFRIRENVMQIGIPIELNAYEMNHKVILQTRGNVTKVGDTIVFQPGELWVGSCPLENIPAAKEFVMQQVLARAKFPDDLVAAWKNVGDVVVEGSTVRVTAR
jgi:hypothetical protein